MSAHSNTLRLICPLPATASQSSASILVDDLARLILRRESLKIRDLSRCRYEVLAQLALSPPWHDTGKLEQADEASAWVDLLDHALAANSQDGRPPID